MKRMCLVALLGIVLGAYGQRRLGAAGDFFWNTMRQGRYSKPRAPVRNNVQGNYARADGRLLADILPDSLVGLKDQLGQFRDYLKKLEALPSVRSPSRR